MADHQHDETLVGVFTTDSELKIKLWDNALARMTGVPSEVAIGQQLQALFPEVEARGVVEKLRTVLNSGTVTVLSPAFHRYLIPCSPQKPSRRFEKMLQRSTIAPLLEGEQVVGVLVTIEDVTTRVEQERELAEQLNSSNPQIRLRATEALAHADSVVDERPLVAATGDEDWRIRQAAIGGLTKRSAPDAIAALLDLMRQDHRNLAVLNSALQVLAMTDVDTHATLIEFLADDDPDLRMQAALALGEQRDQRAVPALLSALDDVDLNVRFHAIEALGKLRAVEAAEPLAAIAESREFFLAYPAIDSLRQIAAPDIAPRLVGLISEELLREPTLEALGEIGDERVVKPLTELLNSSDTPALPVAAALSVLHDRFEKKHGESAYIADLCRQSIRPAGMQRLIDALNDTPTEQLRPLALVIGWLRGPAIDRTLVRLLGESSVRADVVKALVQHGEGVIELLIEQLEAENFETRSAAINALGRLGSKRATATLVSVLKRDSDLTVDVANALARIGDEAALDPLLELTGAADGTVRQAVVGALNSIGSSKMPPQIKALLQDERPLVRESAAKIAGYFGYPDCIDLLLQLCHDDDERVRKATVELLPYLEDQRVYSLLTEVLQHDSPRVRAAAAVALGNLDVPESVLELKAALKDSDSWVRYFAARSLGRLAHPEGLDTLSDLARNDSFNHVRIAALEALGHIGGPEAIVAISSQLKAEDRDLARVAASALEKAKGQSG